MSLPSTYQEVEYIESTGTQWINTGYNPDNNTNVECKVNMQPGATYQFPRVFGVRNGQSGTNERDFCLQWYRDNKQFVAVTYNNNDHSYQITSSTLADNTDYVVKQTNTQLLVNGASQGTVGAKTFSISYPVWLFNDNQAGTDFDRKAKMKLYRFKMYNGTTLVRDFIPCYRKSDNEIGLYDLVNDTFYTNSGTGTFTKGPNVVIPYKLHGAIQTFHYKGYNWRDNYQEVKFIQSTATNPGTYTSSGQYIDTLYTPTPNTKIEIDLGFTNTTVQSRLFGVQTEDSSYMTFNAYLNGNGYFARAMIDGTGNWVATTIASDTNRHTFVLDKTGYKIYTNGTQVYSAGNDATPTKNCNHTLPLLANYIFTDSGTTYNKICRHSSAKLYSCKIRDNGTLVRDFIPCYKRSNGEIGLYDLVEGKFYANAGTGTFTKGPDTYEGEIAPTENTLFLLRNNGEISDHSNYNHTMSWYGTENYETLGSGRKVVHTTGSNSIYSDVFYESINKNTFTMHIWFKGISSPSAGYTMGGWMGRVDPCSSCTDRRGLKWQASASSGNLYIIYGANYSDWVQNTSFYITYSTSAFKLYTIVANGSTMTLYENGVSKGSWNGSYAIRGGSDTGPHFYLGAGGHYDGTTPLNNCLPGYFGETILEDRVRTATEISDYYNAFKSDYI